MKTLPVLAQVCKGNAAKTSFVHSDSTLSVKVVRLNFFFLGFCVVFPGSGIS